MLGVKRYVDELSEDAAIAAGLTPEFVLRKLRESLDMAQAEGGKVSDLHKAIELSGKYHKLWTEKRETSISAPLPTEIFLMASDDPADYEREGEELGRSM